MKISMIGAKTRALGFSLMEMIIVVALFSTAAVILSQIFVSFHRLHRKVSNAALLSQDMRFATEMLVRAVRNNQLNYENAPLPSRDSLLSLKAVNGSTIDIALRPGGAQGDCQDETVAQCLALSLAGNPWQPITGKRVDVKRFEVYVRPASSPFVPIGGAYQSNLQPLITLHLEFEYMAPSPKERVSLETHTSVSSRSYLR